MPFLSVDMPVGNGRATSSSKLVVEVDLVADLVAVVAADEVDLVARSVNEVDLARVAVKEVHLIVRCL